MEMRLRRQRDSVSSSRSCLELPGRREQRKFQELPVEERLVDRLALQVRRMAALVRRVVQAQQRSAGQLLEAGLRERD